MLCNNNTEHYQKIYMIEILCICGTFQWYEWKHNISTEVKPTLELGQSCSQLFTRRLCQRSATPAQSGPTISCSYGRRISVYAHWSSPGKHFLNEMLKLCNFWFTHSFKILFFKHAFYFMQFNRPQILQEIPSEVEVASEWWLLLEVDLVVEPVVAMSLKFALDLVLHHRLLIR